MNLAILHYHLNRGGVSRVIENQLAALDSVLGGEERIRVAIFTGGRTDGWPYDLADSFAQLDLSLHVVPGLDYDDRPQAQPDQLAAKLQNALAEIGFLPADTLLHIHNHSLGKNASWPGAIRQLAAQGYAQLLQIHDFAEDFRPRNYRLLAEALGEEQLQALQFPQAAHIHYAVLSRRDESILSAAGVAEKQLHWLPNPVPAPGKLPDRAAARQKLADTCSIAVDQRYLLYPVRGIRRKNLGELLLWSAVAPPGTQFAVTLAPLNPVEREFYDAWESLAVELKLPCQFDTGGEGKMQFTENLAAADLILTTSVAEGFGMVFLEAWLAGLALAGRDLPDVTADFREEGVKLDSLYSRLDVPLDWVGEEEFHSAVQDAYRQVLQSYGRPALGENEFEAAMHAKCRDRCVDFADLNEPLQEKVIRCVAEEESARQELLQRNPQLATALESNANSSTDFIRHNAAVIESRYSALASGTRLRDLYAQVFSSLRDTLADPPAHEKSLLDSFLDLERFRLIRT